METVQLGSPAIGALIGFALGMLVSVSGVWSIVRIRRGDVIPIQGRGVLGRVILRAIFGEQLGYGGASLGLALGIALTGFAGWAWTMDATAIGVDVSGSPVLSYPFPRGHARIEPSSLQQIELRSRGGDQWSLHLSTLDGKTRSTAAVPRETAVTVASALWTKLGRRVPVMECASDARSSCAPTFEPTLRERTARSR